MVSVWKRVPSGLLRWLRTTELQVVELRWLGALAVHLEDVDVVWALGSHALIGHWKSVVWVLDRLMRIRGKTHQDI
jgi:hypothetical protein